MFKFVEVDEEIWKEFDKLFDGVSKNTWNHSMFTTTQNREKPVGGTLTPVTNDMKELLDKYNALKLYVTGIENENKRLKTELETSAQHYGIAVSELRKLDDIKPMLDKMIILMERMRQTL